MSYFLKKIEFPDKWNNQIISTSVRNKIEEITNQILQLKFSNQNDTSHNKITKGNIVLFIGASKKEKTCAAMLIGKSIGMDIYKIDLSGIVSKYIGETEKNLTGIFNIAEDAGWSLLFDEVDALIIKRTEVNDAHDRYTNIDTSFLLQRIEDFSGLVILTSNMKKGNDSIIIDRIKYYIDFKSD